MFFSFDLTIPASTPAAVPKTLDVQLPPGTIHKVEVQFPIGCVGLVHTQAFRGAHPVWPSNPDGNFASNGQTLSWDEEYDMDAAPFLIRLAGWNLDDTYPHTVTWRFAMRPLPPAAQAAALQSLYQLLITTDTGGN